MPSSDKSLVAAALLAVLQACSGADDGSQPDPSGSQAGAGSTQPSTASLDGGGTLAEPDPAETPSLVTVSPLEASQIIDGAPEGLVVLDVRTAAEFSEGHLEGAIQIDFYAVDFEAQLAALDRAAPYVLYCRSGNRSGQTLPMMEQLGFVEVYEIDGGIVAWTAASLPVVAP